MHECNKQIERVVVEIDILIPISREWWFFFLRHEKK